MVMSRVLLALVSTVDGETAVPPLIVAPDVAWVTVTVYVPVAPLWSVETPVTPTGRPVVETARRDAVVTAVLLDATVAAVRSPWLDARRSTVNDTEPERAATPSAMDTAAGFEALDVYLARPFERIG